MSSSYDRGWRDQHEREAALAGVSMPADPWLALYTERERQDRARAREQRQRQRDARRAELPDALWHASLWVLGFASLAGAGLLALWLFK